MLQTKRRRLVPRERRQEILEAAMRVLKARGAAARVEDVVREANAAKGTFYLYFPTWDDLLETIRGLIFEAFEKAHPLPAAGDEVADGAADRAAAIERLAGGFVDAVVAMDGLHEVIFHSDFARRRPLPASEHPIGRLAALIEAGRAGGASADDVDAEPLARLLFAVIHETADAVASGEDRARALAAMRKVLRGALAKETVR